MYYLRDLLLISGAFLLLTLVLLARKPIANRAALASSGFGLAGMGFALFGSFTAATLSLIWFAASAQFIIGIRGIRKQ